MATDKKPKEQKNNPVIRNNRTTEPTGAENTQSQPTNNEQMMRRQSAPRPTALGEYQQMMRNQQMNQMMQGQGIAPNGALDGFRALEQPIGREAVQKATVILQKYKAGKANLERRIVDDEQWYKLRHWECMRKSSTNAVEPTSGWLFNCIANKHAAAMDNFPEPNVLPREEGDKAEAEMLTSIIPVVLDQNEFEATYSDVTNYKMKFGTGVYGVFWDASKLNGLGDIAVKKIDLLSLFWEPGITDIQKSRNLFHVELMDNDLLASQYPQLVGKLSTPTVSVTEYIYDDSVDTTEKSVLVDWYYFKSNSQGKKVLHYVKYVNDTVLFATENDPNYAERGLYDHAEYPFVLDVLFATEGTPTGFGYIDIGKSAQEYIDRGNQCIMQNMLSNARPRHFIRNDGSVNEAEYADLTKDFIHVDGNLGQDSILPVQGKPLNDIYVSIINNKIDELKETTGNRDVATGGTTGGVTAASGLAAQQEAASRLDRDSNKASYRAFRKICLLCIELIRQFYDLPRCFRILGENGTAKFVQYSNAGIAPQAQGTDFGIDMGMRIPLFDVEVSAQKQSPYSKMAQNELALQFYQAGFFNPQMADQALACLDMMDFARKDFIMQKISQNGGMLQQMMLLAQMADNAMGTGGAITQGIAAQYGVALPQSAQQNTEKNVEENGNLGGSNKASESHVTKNARQQAADATSPT